nr:zinc finger BED domain-containing protein RICESLEEPER 2-like [Ipomoea batatas]
MLRLRQIILNAKHILRCSEKKLYKLYDQYVSAIGSSSSQPSSSTIMHSRVESQVARKYTKRLFDDVLDVSDEIVEPVEISELDHYLEQQCYEMKFYQDLDVLDHWKGCVQGFPILSCMARDLLAIPITTFASESAFSIGARVLTKYRSCLLPEKVQTLICTRNWLHGFNMDDDDVDEGNNGDEGDEGDDMNEDELNDGISCV